MRVKVAICCLEVVDGGEFNISFAIDQSVMVRFGMHGKLRLSRLEPCGTGLIHVGHLFVPH